MHWRRRGLAVLAPLVMAISQSAWAGASFLLDEPETEAVQAQGCTRCQRDSVRDHRQVTDYTVREVRSYVPYRDSEGREIPRSCQNIIDQNHQIGPWGGMIARVMDSPRYAPHFYETRALQEICPRFGRLTHDQKRKAWLWFWMVLANDETGCEPSTRHYITPWPGYGMFAAEMRASDRDFRGSMCRGDITRLQTQINCAVHTMSDTQLENGRGVLWSESYWEAVRRYRTKLMPNMRLFTPCFRGEG